MNLFLEPETLMKMNYFLGIFQGFCLTFHRTSFTEHLLVCLWSEREKVNTNIEFYIFEIV